MTRNPNKKGSSGSCLPAIGENCFFRKDSNTARPVSEGDSFPPSIAERKMEAQLRAIESRKLWRDRTGKRPDTS